MAKLMESKGLLSVISAAVAAAGALGLSYLAQSDKAAIVATVVENYCALDATARQDFKAELQIALQNKNLPYVPDLCNTD